MSPTTRNSSRKGGKRKAGDQPSLPPPASTPSTTSSSLRITIPAGNNGVHARPSPRIDSTAASANGGPNATPSTFPPSSLAAPSVASLPLPPPSQLSNTSYAQQFMGAAVPFPPIPGAPPQTGYFMHPSGLPVYPRPTMSAQQATTTHPPLPPEMLQQFSSPPLAHPLADSPQSKSRRAKGKAAARPAKPKAPSKGRKPGSKGYSDKEKLLLARLALKYKPISMDSWKKLTTVYNTKAQAHKLVSREVKGLRSKFESIVQQDPPTGGGEMPEYQSIALDADEQITLKSHSAHVDDDVTGSDASSPVTVPSSPQSYIEISDNDVRHVKRAPPVPQIKTQPDVKPLPVKSNSARVSRDDQPLSSQATRADRPIPSRARRTASTALLSNINTMFDPEEQQAREQTRFAQQLQLQHVNALQSEVQQLRAELSATKDKLHQEERLTDSLRLELRFLKSSHADLFSSPLAFKGRRRVSRDEQFLCTPTKRTMLVSSARPYPVVSPISRRNATPGPSRPLAALPLATPEKCKTPGSSPLPSLSEAE